MAQLNESQLFALVQQIKTDDPALKELTRQIVARFQVIFAELYEPLSASTEQVNVVTETEVSDVEVFTYTLLASGIKFEWERPDPSAVLFEIRQGSSWDSASRQLVTATVSAVLEGRPPGTYRYLLKAQALDGTYSENALALDVVIPAIGMINLTGQIIDNFVLLNWNVPTSAFRIDYYIVTRGGIEIGRQSGTFHSTFESTGGTYQYGVQAVDIFGNVSDVATKDIVLSQPSDYILEALESSSLNGTRTNVVLSERPSLLVNVSETETWNDYAGNGYSTLQDEINADYPYYLQPTVGSGEYLEVFDYGAIFDGVIVTADWSYIEHVATMQVDCYLSTSLDNITYTAEINSVTMYAPSMRYLKMRLVFTALS